jgi:nitrogen fixation/metabolism regulation signal transduction histidine kinase
VFFTDLSLYSTDGSLIASSRKEIFNNGLIGGKMNPVAFNALSKKEKPDFIQNENIGDLFFLSAYVPFRNRDNKLLAYLNLPYFAKEGELRKEISTLLVALINFYLMLIVVSIGIALFLSNKITQPLRIIQDKIAQIKIGQPNEPIEWKGNDELGGLVAEYNRMLDELSISAERLAQSERESAWREMAKQVAHEIKNPLTPMKLSVQHLERAWNEKSTDWDDRLKRFSKTLINQIDALAKIAEEFSAFAKMPKADQKVIDLDNLIQSIIPLFQETENLSLVYRPFKSAAKPSVFVDKEQIVRVLNNLIKNSVDATSEKDNRKIIIELSERQKQFIVMVKDNGCGIDAKEKNKIFTPKFTTKSSGMGLGLAIVKNIISNSNGDVWFDSEIGVGSSFYFSLPKHSG